MELDTAVKAYNSFRVPGNDHGIMGAYLKLFKMYPAEPLPSLAAIMDRRCVVSAELGDDCGHHCGIERVGNAPAVTRHCSCPECHGKPVA